MEVPDSILQTIAESKKYAEGRAVRIEVRTKSDLEAVLQIAAAKMST